MAPLSERKETSGQRLWPADLFSQSVQLAGVVNAAGKLRPPIKLKVALLCVAFARVQGERRFCL